ncbi:MAG: hypothetical protein AAGE86_06205, partial [Pseudomonadota bacterium]
FREPVCPKEGQEGSPLPGGHGGAETCTVIPLANGLLLPVVAAFLLYAMNQRSVLGDYANGRLANVFGTGVVLIAAGLGLRLILRAAGVL